jgi:glycolate oxidase iron-sulfur subunit
MAEAGAFAALDPCVHCGFCLQACPTYLATGDEADSPRGRIVLMRALERGEISPHDAGLLQHLDACLGCRGCEPVCPSGVGYGRGLEAARRILAETRGLSLKARAILTVFRHRWLWRPVFALSRLVRRLGLPRRLAGRSALGFNFAMLDASAPAQWIGGSEARWFAGSPARRLGDAVAHQLGDSTAGPAFTRASRGTVALFRGCVMNELFDHVHQATRRTLEANGYRVVEVRGQGCCGALHEHAGDTQDAVTLARQNVAAFSGTADFIVVNSAGCGALLKDYGHLLHDDTGRAFAARVRDVSELLADQGPRRGGALPICVAYDAPCHLQHAQRVHAAPLAVLAAIPELRVQHLAGSDRCCGSAGIYSMLEPSMSRAVLEAKIQVIAEVVPRPALVTTGNPGCLMQIGAGLSAARLPIRAVHPVELLDWSYEAGGVYEEKGEEGGKG